MRRQERGHASIREERAQLCGCRADVCEEPREALGTCRAEEECEATHVRRLRSRG